MGQITATRNLVATKVVRHAGQQVRGREYKKAAILLSALLMKYVFLDKI